MAWVQVGSMSRDETGLDETRRDCRCGYWRLSPRACRADRCDAIYERVQGTSAKIVLTSEDDRDRVAPVRPNRHRVRGDCRLCTP
jgi:hypothetical protein